MKVLLTSDWHIEEGIYTDICIDYIDHLIEYSNENKITHIIIAGDIFEKSSKIKNQAFIPLFFKFMEMKKLGFQLYFIIGNHDAMTEDNDSLVETFSPFGTVVKEYTEVEIAGRKFGMLPYTKDPNEVPLSGDVLVTHLSIADFTFDNKYHVNEKMGMSTDTFENYSIVFSGHFHRPQNKKNIVFMGSPYQMNFGEIGQEKGFVVFDTESGDWKREYYTGAPTYLRIKASDFQNTDVSNSFVQVEIEQKLDNYVQLKHILYEGGALEVSPSFKETTEDIKIEDGDETLDLNVKVKDMMREYILNNVKVEGIEGDKLLELFEKVVEV